MTDLSDFTPSYDTVSITLKHPTTEEVLKNKDGTDMTIEVYTQTSTLSKHAFRDVANTQLKKIKLEKNEELSEEEIFLASFQLGEVATVDLLSKTTKGWNITFGDEMPKFSFEKARKLYAEVPLIRDQVYEGLQKDTGFTKA